MQKSLIILCCILGFAAFGFMPSNASAESSYFAANCTSCHAASPTTCNGCHSHGTHSNSNKNVINITGTTSKATYAPGESVSVTMTGGYRTGWIRGLLLDQNGVELARSTGAMSGGMGGGMGYPIVLNSPAPSTPGTYTWKVAWYGNQYDASSSVFGTGWTPDPNNPNHGMEVVSTNSFTVSAGGATTDTTPPTITGFSMPAMSSSMTMMITSFTATDNVGVTGYMVTTSATAPLANAAGWSATAPTSYMAGSAGANTMYAWAKDAAGNVSSPASASVNVSVSVTDTTPPSAPSGLTASVMANSVKLIWGASSDNVGVTGYKVFRDGTQIGSTAMTSYTDMAIAPTTTYNYTVEAADAAGNVSAASNTATATTLAGGTGGTGGTGPAGNYVFGMFGWRSSGQPFWDQMYNLGIDSQGNFSGNPMGSGSSMGMGNRMTGMVTTTAEGLMSFGTTGGMSAQSADGNAMAWADTSTAGDNALSIGLGFRASGHMGRSKLKGTYVIGGVAMTATGTGQVTSTPFLVNIQFKGNGRMSYRNAGTTGGNTDGGEGAPGNGMAKSGRYQVANNGKVTMKVNGMQLQGFARSDGAVLSLVQVGNSGRKTGMAIGVSTSSGLNAGSMAGDYTVAQTAITGDLAWTGVSAMTFDGSGNFSAQDLYSSDGQPYASGGTYTMGTGGQLTMSTGDSGMLSPDAQVFMSMDNGATDGTIRLMVGVRQ